MTILSVAYPCAPVGPDAVGGAEQVLSHIDAKLVRSGHQSIVVGCEGSTASGKVVAWGSCEQRVDEDELARAQTVQLGTIEHILKQSKVDLVHMHGIDFHRYMPRYDVPVLATLHLPLDWYPPEIFSLGRPRTYLHCVSASQRAAAPLGAELLPCIENGVPTRGLPRRHAKRSFVISLGRICPEKGFHLAMDAAVGAGIPFLLAGTVYRYDIHQEYFCREIQPRLDTSRKFIGPVSLDKKQRLLTAARAVLIPSLVQETSSLVAMEALACGTPVIAFPKGALTGIVEHGKTGFLVDSVPEMMDAIDAAAHLDPSECIRAARERFSVDSMTARYLHVYRRIIRSDVMHTRMGDVHAA